MSAHSAPSATHRTDQTEDVSLFASELSELFGDEYTRRVYEAITDQPRSGRATAEVAGVSRATAYRRLDDLGDAGFVRPEMTSHEDGRHKNSSGLRRRRSPSRSVMASRLRSTLPTESAVDVESFE